jgi:hypothetical protein
MAWWGKRVTEVLSMSVVSGSATRFPPFRRLFELCHSLVRNVIDSRARVLVVELLLCLVSQSLQLGILVRKLLVILELLQEVFVGVGRGSRDVLTLLDCRAIVDRLPPLL